MTEIQKKKLEEEEEDEEGGGGGKGGGGKKVLYVRLVTSLERRPDKESDSGPVPIPVDEFLKNDFLPQGALSQTLKGGLDMRQHQPLALLKGCWV